MNENESEKAKASGTRGSSYPFISLKEAILRTQTFFDQEGKNAAPVAAAIEHWGYGAKSSGGRQTVAAMLQYGLMRDEGSSDNRRLSLTKLGLDILLTEKDSASYREALKISARSPRLFREIFQKYPEPPLPSDTTLRHFLIAEKDVTPGAVASVIKNFRDNLAFSGLSGPASLPLNDAKPSQPEPPKIGDFIQWESDGALQFDLPRRVRAVQGVDWVFIDGSNAGIPISEISVETRSEAPKAQPPILPEEQPVREREWIRGPLSKEISYRILVNGDLTPREIGKLIKILEAQKTVLSDDEDTDKQQ